MHACIYLARRLIPRSASRTHTAVITVAFNLCFHIYKCIPIHGARYAIKSHNCRGIGPLSGDDKNKRSTTLRKESTP